MADLTKPMSDAAIQKLDYFEKSQLYHNVYINTPYSELPVLLRRFYNEDSGLIYLQSVLANSNLQNPYEIAKLIQTLKPAKPHTLQEVYNRAKYLADVCDTTVDKILRSDVFNGQDFIPQFTEEKVQEILKKRVTGAPAAIKNEDYTPTPSPSPSGDSDTPVVFDGDYATENKIYFTVNNMNVTCNKTFNEVISKLPKLPEAELVLNAIDDYQNISNITCGYDANTATIHFNFIQMYTTTIKLFTIHFSANKIELEENSFIINANT